MDKKKWRVMDRETSYLYVYKAFNSENEEYIC